MNPSTVDQRHIKTIIDRALEKCINEQANTEFLIQVKKDLLRVTQQGRAALSDEFFDQPLVLNDGEIIIPSPRQIFEYEEHFHQNSLDLHVELPPLFSTIPPCVPGLLSFRAATVVIIL